MIRRNKVIATLLVAATVVNIGATKVMAYESISNGQVVNTLEGYLSEGNLGEDTEGKDSLSESTKEVEVGQSTELSDILSVSSSSKLVNNLSKTTSEVSIIESQGWLESASVEWNAVLNATGYNVYYKIAGANDSEYTRLDDELIRKYPDNFRADILGLAEGQYEIKIVPIINDKEATSAQAITEIIEVTAHTREGFAFSQESTMKTSSGGYNDDGTVAEDAQIIYITAENVNTVQTDVITNSKGTKTTTTGLVNILSARGKGYDKRPLIIRMIGQINGSDINGLNSSGYIQIKGAYNVTFEGVGEDATVYGWGFLIRNSKNIELRNLGVMMFPDDAISLDTANENIWVHNNDIFYGAAGSDADQVKGDGSADVKGKSTYVTLSYNHFYDSGKVSLCGMSDTEEFFVTYHHNWFDHSDSRHPRIRVGTVHIYNNYFDGNSKYGVGVTKGSSAFVEANDFRNSKYPMLSSLQGSDIAGGSKGNFSGEAGGMIKAYNNKIVGATRLVYVNENSTQFDAYLALTREEKVSSSYKTVSGGTTYNNFDTSSKMYEYTPDSPDEVRGKVTTYAGRVNGGDFKWEFTTKEDTSYSVNAELMKAIKSYSSKLVSVGGNGGDYEIEDPSEPTPPVTPDPEVPVEPVDPEIPVEPEVPVEPVDPEIPVEPEVPVAPVEPDKPTDSEKPEEPEEEQKSVTHNFTTDNKISDFFTINGSLSSNKGIVEYEVLTLTQCLKIETSTSIKFATSSNSKLTLVFNSNFNKGILIDGVEYTANNGILTVDLNAGEHSITKCDTGNLYYISIE